MTTHLYLSLIPEALIASGLGPHDFGRYFAMGTAKRTRGQAVFFSVDAAALDPDDFDLEDLDARCAPHPDGRAKHSLYLAIYRVLERVPRHALTALHLTTDDGITLTLNAAAYAPDGELRARMYQEFCPVTPRVVSRLDPVEFTRFITDTSQPIHVPRIAFTELTLGELRSDPDSPDVEDLPYPQIPHLRDCLRELAAGSGKATKTVMRQMTQEVLFRTVRSAFYVGDATGITAFPMPSHDSLEREHRPWWRSALTSFGH
ncbi:hypothetical protein [Demequina sp.]|uniref:hypothetical protein n=1 Tax=Demequina sp. TaxID=2050685 RepID=UPI0025CC8BA6|nr:hypothetical protein [Demequina sp.]